VIPYWERWMRELPDIAALAGASSETIHKLWEGLGYYTRVRNMQLAARVIMKEHAGRFPRSFDHVLALPGIGRYTAGAICSIAFNQPEPIVDGNVIRVLTRIFGIGKDPREKTTNALLWSTARELVTQASHLHKLSTVPRGGKRRRVPRTCSDFNQSLMELGALICTPKQPRCGECPVAAHCVALQTGGVAQLPKAGRRIATTPRTFAAFVLEQRGRFLVRQRPPGVVNGHLWEFPNAELTSSAENLPTAAKTTLGFRPKTLDRLCSIKHSITRFRITLNAYKVNGAPVPKGVQGQWLTLQQLQQRSFPSAHKRILKFLGHAPQ
jgi:A/G-specific adenine glycosylase